MDNIAVDAAVKIEPYVLAALERYLASDQGQARIGEFVDQLLLTLIARMKG
ncbi:MAG TPA: hypothetical protein VEU08_24030 [Vicinamibacterales bacterium]|nr:hypothetical protein [Vicinamibacterales bacterium]